MPTPEVVTVSYLDAMAIVVLNRPEKRNALDGETVNTLLKIFQDLAENSEVKMVLFKTQGNHFCAGADIQWMKKMAACSEAENLQDAQAFADLLYAMYHLPQPFIVLTQGATLGGGLGLVAAADIVIAEASATYCFSEVKIGVIPAIVSPYVIAAIGERAARYYFLTAASFSAHEAQGLGLVHQVVEAESLNVAGLNLAHEILKNSTSALFASKKLIHEVAGQKINPELSRTTAQYLASERKSADAREGLQAFLEKRVPKWSKV